VRSLAQWSRASLSELSNRRGPRKGISKNIEVLWRLIEDYISTGIRFYVMVR